MLQFLLLYFVHIPKKIGKDDFVNKEEILSLAKEKGIKLSYLNDLINGYRGKLTDWKNNKTSLTEDEVSVITNYLLGNDNVKVYDDNDNIVVIDDETRDIIDSLRTRPEMKILFSVSKKATKKDIEKAVAIIEALKDTEK